MLGTPSVVCLRAAQRLSAQNAASKFGLSTTVASTSRSKHSHSQQQHASFTAAACKPLSSLSKSVIKQHNNTRALHQSTAAQISIAAIDASQQQQHQQHRQESKQQHQSKQQQQQQQDAAIPNYQLGAAALAAAGLVSFMSLASTLTEVKADAAQLTAAAPVLTLSSDLDSAALPVFDAGLPASATNAQSSSSSSATSKVVSALGAATSSATSGAAKRRLPQPDKFDSVQQNAQHVAMGVQVQPGIVFRCGIPLMQVEHKQGTLQPSVMLTPEGNVFHIAANTVLGKGRHQFEAMHDINNNSSGSYKFCADNGLDTKFGFQLTPAQGNAVSVDLDYNAKESITQFTAVVGSHGMLSHMQQLTPNLSAGVQLIAVPGAISFLNYCAKYDTRAGEQIALNTSQGNFNVSYLRKVFELPDLHNPMYAIPTSLTLATICSVSTQDREAMVAAGMINQQHNYRYSAMLNTELTVACNIDITILSGQGQLSIGGELKHDGSNENKFGVAFSLG